MNDQSRNLDVLRAVAVLCVFLSHTPGLPKQFGIISAHQLGVGGVLFFFVHTSLVLFKSISRTKSRRPFLDFYLRRAFRIYPLSILCVLSMTALRIAGPSVDDTYQWIGFRGLLSNIALIQNITRSPDVIGPLWSLPWEVQMYLALPAIYLILSRSRAPLRVIGVMWLGSLGMGWLSLFSVEFAVLRAAIYPAFFLGGILAYQLLKKVRPEAPALAWPAMILLLIGLRGLGLNLSEEFYAARNMAVNATICLLLGAALPHFKELRESTLTRASHLIAKYSYGIYLFHTLAIHVAFVDLVKLAPPIRWAVLVILSVAIPVILYHTVEEPVIRLGRSIARRWGIPSRSLVSLPVGVTASP